MRSRFTMAMVAGLLAIAAILLLAWVGQRRLIYFPFGSVLSPHDVGLGSVEDVTFDTADGLALRGWFVRPSEPSTGFTLIVFNGNAGNRAYRGPLAAALRARGVSVLLFDYRGYGGNPGTPTEDGLAADAEAARAFVVGRTDVDAGRVAYFGESLGAAVAVTLASRHPPAALVLRSPFTSLVDMGARHYPFLPVRWLLKDRFASLDRIGTVRSPLLVIAGDRDAIVPIEQSRQLFEAANAPKRLVVLDGADHNDEDLSAGPEVVEAVLQLLQEVPGTVKTANGS